MSRLTRVPRPGRVRRRVIGLSGQAWPMMMAQQVTRGSRTPKAALAPDSFHYGGNPSATPRWRPAAKVGQAQDECSRGAGAAA